MIVETIETLEQKLEFAKREAVKIAESKPLLNTGFVFDLTNSTLTSDFLIGVAIKTATAHCISQEHINAFIDEATKGGYMNAPAVCAKWFGFIYITEEYQEIGHEE